MTCPYCPETDGRHDRNCPRWAFVRHSRRVSKPLAALGCTASERCRVRDGILAMGNSYDVHRDAGIAPRGTEMRRRMEGHADDVLDEVPDVARGETGMILDQLIEDLFEGEE